MGNLLKKLADPFSLFDGGNPLSSILDPLQIFGKGDDKFRTGVPAQEAAPAQAPDTLMTPTVMPTADSDAQRAARRKSQADQAKRRGRQSTILTGNDDSLGTTG